MPNAEQIAVAIYNTHDEAEQAVKTLASRTATVCTDGWHRGHRSPPGCESALTRNDDHA